MSATDQMRDMISQLMGTTGGDGDNKDRLHFTDPYVCRAFLIGTCQYDILSGTRMDLGNCSKVHDVALKADFERAQKGGKDYFYDMDALDQLDRFIQDCDRKADASRKRLEETQEEISQENTEKAEAVLALNEEIGKTLAEAEALGEEGKVDESLKLMEKVDELRNKKQAADTEYRSSMPATSYQQQKLRVCDVCSAYLGIHDNDRRLADHFGGKLHTGFVFLREKLTELRGTREERRAAREAARGASRSDWDRDRPPRDDYYRDRDQGRDRRDRDRDRDRDRYRERDRDRDRRRDSSRDREREASRRDRDKDRDKDRDARDKDRGSRDKDRVDRNKDREGRAKDRDSRDKDRDSRNKDRDSRDKDRDSRNKDRDADDRSRKSSSRDQKRDRSRSRESQKLAAKKRSESKESVESGEVQDKNGKEDGEVKFSDVDE